MSPVLEAARRVLDDGVLCYLAAPSPVGPHVTPVVYVLEGDRIWGTTARRTVKARLWRRERTAGVLVRIDERAVTFRGPVTLYDALDPSTWGSVVRRGPQVALASARFTLKNARFFAGYARDAYRVPFGWTPPGRVVFSVDLEAGALVEGGGLVERWGPWRGGFRSARSYRGARGTLPRRGLPGEVRALLDGGGAGTLGVPGDDGPVVLPVRWVPAGRAVLAVLPRRLLELTAPKPGGSSALVVDRVSSWRAADMTGALLRGPSELLVPDEMRSGRDALLKRIAVAGDLPPDPAVVRIEPRAIVWWHGWTSGTVETP